MTPPPILAASAAVILLGLVLFPIDPLAAAPPRDLATLFATGKTLDIGRIKTPQQAEAKTGNSGVILRGPGGKPTTFVILPPGGNWDMSAWNHLRVVLSNPGKHLTRIEGRLDNPDALDWSMSLPGTAVIPASGQGSLGFSFTRAADAYDGPEIFRSQSARPNGHRGHWRPFDPAKVIALRLTVHSAGPFELRTDGLQLCWPAGSAANQDLEALPYLDRFGQVRALDWPGKLRSIQDLTAALDAEERAAANAQIPGTNRFGGWKDGPQQKATGFFRTGKINGKWWLIDPDGALFWSHGVNSAGLHNATPCGKERRTLFEWLPAPGDPLHEVMIHTPRKNQPPHANFLRANLTRAWGETAVPRAHQFNHQRLRSWGINTLGAWSDKDMQSPARTPYTATTGVWVTNLNQGAGHMLPDPFDPRFEAALRQTLTNHSHVRQDPWCLGVFIDNELDWANDLAPVLFAAGPKRPVKSAFLSHLRKRYPDLAALNKAWKTQAPEWEALLAMKEPPAATDALTSDVESFYAIFAERYFATCKRLMRELLPNHLYLGCRIHRAPAVVIDAAVRHVDVFSYNNYSNIAGAAMLPAGADIPVLISEFHFGAPDRGVPGTGLLGVNDQLQRGLAYTAFVTGGLIDPRIVGTHWFAFPDQSAAGRPGENYQIGFIDVTGRAYPEFTAAVRRISLHLYRIRHQAPSSIEAILEDIP